MIEAVSHVTFVVKNLERMTRFLHEILDAEEVYDSAAKNFSVAREKFFVIGGTWVAIMEGEPLPERSYNHVAFKIPDAQFDEYAARVVRLGVEVKPGRGRVDGEGRSLYFYDYDNHLFELHTGTLEQRLVRYARG